MIDTGGGFCASIGFPKPYPVESATYRANSIGFPKP